MIDTLVEVLERAEAILNYEIVKLGDVSLTLGKITYLLFLLVVLVVVTRLFGRWFTNRVLARTQLDEGAREATGRLTSYGFAAVGLLMVLQASGIDLTTLNIFAGAIGVAVGFGMQAIANNFISGLIILFERPIKLGDRIEVGGVHGKVVEIRARSTTVVTNNNIAIIIPNSQFIEQNVVNWSYKEAIIRFEVPVGVSYGSDPRTVERTILAAARDSEEVLVDPAPDVLFSEFGDSALIFKLRAWTRTQLHQKDAFVSELNFAIHEHLAKNGITVPFPQRDLHVRSGTLDVRLMNSTGLSGNDGARD